MQREWIWAQEWWEEDGWERRKRAFSTLRLIHLTPIFLKDKDCLTLKGCYARELFVCSSVDYYSVGTNEKATQTHYAGDSTPAFLLKRRAGAGSDGKTQSRGSLRSMEIQPDS
jgi:hypothetical protein